MAEERVFDADGFRWIVPGGAWHEEPETWDRVVIGEDEWPCLAKVEISRANKWDDKKAKGSHGGEREYSGADLAKVKISLRYIAAADHQRILSQLLPKIEPTPGKKEVGAHKFDHAVAYARRVSHITIDSISGPNWERGVATIDIDATEHRPPEKKNATGKAKGGSGTAQGQSENCESLANQYAQANVDAADLEAQIARETAEYNAGSGDHSDLNNSVRQSIYNGVVAEKREQQKNAYARADGAAKQMQAQGCNKSKPSGNSAVTDP